MKAYVGSYGFRDCDPIGAIAVDASRFSYGEFVDLLEKAAEEDARMMYESADWGEETFEEFAEELVLYYTPHVEMFVPCEEHAGELKEQGWVEYSWDCGCRIGGE
jgi:hypothetical protein